MTATESPAAEAGPVYTVETLVNLVRSYIQSEKAAGRPTPTMDAAVTEVVNRVYPFDPEDAPPSWELWCNRLRVLGEYWTLESTTRNAAIAAVLASDPGPLAEILEDETGYAEPFAEHDGF